MATITKNGTPGTPGTSGAAPTPGTKGGDATYSLNGMNGADSTTLLVYGGNGGAGGNGTGTAAGANGGNGGNATGTINGNIYNAPVASTLTVALTTTGGNGGLGGTSVSSTPGLQGNGGNASSTVNGNIVQPNHIMTTIEFDSIAVGGNGTKYGNASATLNGNIFQNSKGTDAVILRAQAYSAGPDPYANNGNTNFGLKTANISGNIVQNNVNNVYLYADTYNPATPNVGANGTATISGNVIQSTSVNPGFVSLEASGQHIVITQNKITVAKQELDLAINQYGPTYDTQIKTNEFKGSGTNTFAFADNVFPGPKTPPDTIAIDLGAGTFTFNGNSNTLTGFANATVSGNNAATIAGDNNINTLTGGNGDDTISGLGGNDIIYGSGGNDLLTGGAGNDTIDGGAGLFDTAVYSGLRSQYTIALSQTGTLSGTVTDNVPSRDGTDTLMNVEYLKFADGLYDVANATFIPGGPVNTPPVANNDTFTTAEDNALVIAAAGVLANDTDADANPLTSVLVTGPAHGTLTLNPNGSFTYTPTANYNGADSFTYKANDGLADSNIATVNLTITPVNDAPVATNDAYSTAQNTALNVAAAGVLANDTDVDGDALTSVLVAGPAHGMLTLNANGSFTYTPTIGYTGADAFSYKANDGTTTSNTAIVNISVGTVNHAPAGTDKTITTLEDTFYTFTVSDFGFTDPGDAPPNTLQAVKITTLPASGTLTDNNVAVTTGQFVSLADITGGLLKFTPAVNANGTPQTVFTFQVQDNGGTGGGGVDLDQTPNTITFNVTPVNDAPAGANNTITTLEDTAYTFAAADFGFTDPNDSPANTLLAVKITTLPASGTLTDNNVAVTAGQFVSLADITGGLLKFTPAPNANGSPNTAFTFQVQDNGGIANGGIDLDQTPNTIIFNVTPVNDAPAGTNNAITTLEDTAYTFSVADFGFTDPNDSPANTLLAVKITTLPASGTLTDNNVAVTAGQFVSLADITGGLLKFTPAANANGAPHTTFTFQVQDNGGIANGGIDLDQSPNTITVNVTSVNDAPVGTANTVNALEDVVYTFTAANFGFTDPNDAPANTLQAVKITTLPANGILKDNGVAVTAGQFVSAADIAGGLLTFTSAANAGGAGYGNFTFQVQDNGGTANGGVNLDPIARALTLNVAPVNDAPVGTDKTVTILEDTSYTFGATDFGFSDPNDVPANTLLAVKITTLPAAGTLTDNNVAVTAGQFVSLADITGGLLKFTPAANATGSANFSFQVQDNGGTANGGLDLDQSPNVFIVNITPVNDAPAGTNNIITTLEDNAYTFATSDFGFTDPNDTPPDALQAVKITTLPANGSLTDNGIAVTAGQFVSAADIAGGLVVFTPAANANGAGYGNFTFQVQDTGGTSNGGVNLDQSPNSITLNVTPVNDAPVANNDAYSTDLNTTLNVPAAGVLTNDTDVDLDTLNSVLVTGPANGTLTLNSDGSFSYTPTANFSGADSFTYRANDGALNSNNATVSITINAGQTFLGTPGNDTLTGGNSDDTFYATTGIDTIDGMGNSPTIGDTVVFSNATSGVDANLGPAPQDFTASGLGITTLTNIENLTGSTFDDTLTGVDGVRNTLSGGAGNDTLVASSGDGVNGDTLDGGADSDTADFRNATSGVTVTLGAPNPQDVMGGIGPISLVSIENLTGSGFDDILTGDAGNNIIDGGAGGTDTVSYYPGTSDGLVVDLTLGMSSGGGAGNDTLYNIQNVGGSAFNDALIGDSGDNTLSGYEGNDILYGHAGTNFLLGGNDTDVAYYSGLETAYTTFATTTVSGGPENVNDFLSSVERLKFLSPTHVQDVDSNGRGDLITQNNATGNLVIETQPAGTVTVAGVGANWLAIGTGQFSPDADRAADVLLQDTTNGNLEVITDLNGAQTQSLLTTQPGSVNWKAITAGDFNGDAASDVLLQNTATGAAEILFLNTNSTDAPGTVASVAAVTTPGANWKAIASGDFNGDGKSDILWQNSATKAVEVYLMNGANVINTPVAQTATGLTAIGTGDFNGDGGSDILFKNASGQGVIWFMNGDSHVGTKTVNRPTAATTWNLTGASDVDGNGYSDLIWTNSATGMISASELGGPSSMTSTTVLNGNAMVGSFSPAFHLVASTGGG